MRMDYKLDPPDEIDEDDPYDPEDEEPDPDRMNDLKADRDYERDESLNEFYRLDDGNIGD